MKQNHKRSGIIITIVITSIVLLCFLIVMLLVPLLLFIFLPLSTAMIVVAIARIRELKEEDEDDYRKY